LFEALADGRLHLTAVNLIGPHLSKPTVDDWIAAATHKTRAEIQALIAIRRPRPDGPDGMVRTAEYVLEQVSRPGTADRATAFPLPVRRSERRCGPGSRKLATS